jgi:hypothetical protein
MPRLAIPDLAPFAPGSARSVLQDDADPSDGRQHHRQRHHYPMR